MGIFDSFKKQASDLMDKAKEHQADGMADGARDQMGEGIQQAGKMADDATGNRFGERIDQGVDIARQRLGKPAEDPAEADRRA